MLWWQHSSSGYGKLSSCGWWSDSIAQHESQLNFQFRRKCVSSAKSMSIVGYFNDYFHFSLTLRAAFHNDDFNVELFTSTGKREQRKNWQQVNDPLSSSSTACFLSPNILNSMILQVYVNIFRVIRPISTSLNIGFRIS